MWGENVLMGAMSSIERETDEVEKPQTCGNALLAGEGFNEVKVPDAVLQG
jgi:hypothetical protein